MGRAALVRDIFIQKGQATATEIRRSLMAQGVKMSYEAIERLFYDLRQLSLIYLVKEEFGNSPIKRRYYRITSGREKDPIWNGNPHQVLYPSSALGGLKYIKGSSQGRARIDEQTR